MPRLPLLPARLPTDAGWSWSRRRGSPLTSRDGPSGGRVDAHGWEAGRGEFALTLPVLGPVWGEREGVRVVVDPSATDTPRSTWEGPPALGLPGGICGLSQVLKPVPA